MLLFWLIFWVLYGLLFAGGLNTFLWLFGIRTFSREWIFLIVRAEAVKLVLWVIGGMLGGIIGATFSLIEGKMKWVLEIFFWMFFWQYFLSLVAAVFWLKDSAILIIGPELSTQSQMPIIIFGALGGAIGTLVSQVIEARFFQKR